MKNTASKGVFLRIVLIGSIALLWQNAKCKFADKHVWLSLGFTLCFTFRQSKATDTLLKVFEISDNTAKSVFVAKKSVVQGPDKFDWGNFAHSISNRKTAVLVK